MTAQQQPVSPADLIAHNLGPNKDLLLSGDGVFKTIQGEGPRLGRLTTFVRLGTCNLNCAWCDTSYTWDWRGQNGRPYIPSEELVPTTQAMLKKRLLQNWSGSITITGGEPLIQWKKLDEFFPYFGLEAVQIPELNFETNGTIYPSWSAQTYRVVKKINYVVSPKLRHSGCGVLSNPEKYLPTLGAFARLNPLWGAVDYKFVCEQPEDLDEVAEILEGIDNSGGIVIKSQVWIMPQGIEPGLIDQRARNLVDGVIERGWNLTTRYHQHLWNNARAR